MTRLVAVTGATGFLGSAILPMLRAEGWRVRALVRRRMELPGVDLIQADILNRNALQKLVQDVDAVIHCAGCVRGASERAFQLANVEGTARLADAAASLSRPPRFLLMSSLAAREPALSWYAASKCDAEKQLLSRSGLPCTIMRPTAVYGPGDREIKPLFTAMRRGILPVPGRVDARVSLLHVSDLVTAIRAWLSAPTVGTGPYELHDGTPGGYDWYAIREAGQMILNRKIRLLPVPMALLGSAAHINLWFGRIIGYAPMLTPGKIRELRHPDWRCDNTAVTRDLGWQPEYRLADSLRQQFFPHAA